MDISLQWPYKSKLNALPLEPDPPLEEPNPPFEDPNVSDPNPDESPPALEAPNPLFEEPKPPPPKLLFDWLLSPNPLLDPKPLELKKFL